MGLWGGLQRGKEVWVLVMEDAGEELDLFNSEDASVQSYVAEADRAAIVSMYDRLHENGVLHGDVQPRHWRRRLVDKSDPTAIRFIDFDRAILRSFVSEAMWEKCKRRERITIQSKITGDHNLTYDFPSLPSSATNSDVNDDTGTVEARYPLGYVNGREPYHSYGLQNFEPLGYGSFQSPWLALTQISHFA
ncbi:hypothetical protein TREMEDRAFT_72489 [Tremella mesenterica DSM 1558]|uniref:uncharacterized protein n=1 Tax=Tremella mesenterica (strain ATCC 24925 / CBS 8224 / DSM 1558 / NBRC 9311 / NRRL Y-6157 / RJB 2259-6 / UBC 559-6) TaxID=578456 RepID=UPI00032BBE5A|nr:uncharacterized protein TREMEDRAFT_72489 [Tremella mesenterica DSM 1558]EIW66118.1 hypothetical protein TREMEDRAFT_72489 [Tremella mesenterica DSM 1558]